MIRRPPRSTQSRSSAASDVYKRQIRQRVNVSNYIPHSRWGVWQDCVHCSDYWFSYSAHEFQNVAAKVTAVKSKLVLNIHYINFRAVYLVGSSHETINVAVFDNIKRS